MKGLFDSARLQVEVNGQVFDVALKPRHALVIQEHFAGQDDVASMRQTLYSAWIVLNEDGRYPGDFDSFVASVEDVGVPEDGNPKSLIYREVAALAVLTGIAPNDLLDTPYEVLERMAEVIRAREAHK